MRDAALGDGDSAIPNFYVAADADLSRENDIVADIGCSGEADLRTKQRVVPDRAAMADVDHVVDLRAASNTSLADAGAVDARVRLNFRVALDDNISRLDDFVPAAFIVLRKPEAVGADHRTIL